MNNLNSIQQGYLVLFSAIYLFIFRDATRKVALWGAFEFRDGSVLTEKIIPYSVPILLLLPAIAYFLFATVVTAVALEPKTTAPTVHHLGMPALIVFGLGIFPWVPLHAWSFVASKKMAQGTAKGQPGWGWLNSQRCHPDDLPLRRYSLQVLIAWCVLFLIIIIVYGPSILSILFKKFPYEGTLGRQVFIVLYLSQLVVLFYISKMRGFYEHKEHKARWLLSIRMCLTIPLTIVVPVVFGAFVLYPMVVSLDKRILPLWFIIPLLISLPFPYYCNQSMLLVEKWRAWKVRQEVLTLTEPAVPSEVSEAKTTFWWLCLIMAVVCAIVLVLIRNEWPVE